MINAVAAGIRTFISHDVIRFAILLAAAVFLLDWATKSWALQSLEHTSIAVGAVTLDVERNSGFAFSTGAGRVPAEVVFAVRLAAIGGLLLLFVRAGARSRRIAAGFALLIGGGLGNTADLLFRGGEVVDLVHAGPVQVGSFVHAGIVFNGADLAIFIALGFLAPLIREWAASVEHRIAAWDARWVSGGEADDGEADEPTS
jgi:signal peptidase II